jgi:hypothetical protein
MTDLAARMTASWKNGLRSALDRWNHLSDRERKLISILFTILALYLGQKTVDLLFVSPYERYYAEEESLKSDILLAQALSQEIRKSQDEIRSRSLRLAQDRSGFSLISYLEQEAAQSRIRSSITQMTPRTLPSEGGYHSVLVSLRIENVDLPHVLFFLARIERSPHLLRITRLTMERRFDHHRLLDVHLDVQSIQSS